MIPTPGWVEIDLSAIDHNLGVVRETFSSVDVCAVLKADAYGHGIEHVLPLVMQHGFQTIGITSNDEALTARFLGYTGRILRLRPALADEVEEALVHEVEEWVGGSEHAAAVARVAHGRGVRIPVHVSINSTGLGRDGIELHGRDDRGADELTRVLAHDSLRVAGVCSHFPVDDPVDMAHGAETFRSESELVLQSLAPADRGAVQRHCATSFAAITVPEARFDLVRIGAAIYGDTVNAHADVKPAFTLKSRVVAVNDYRAGSTVGYDRTHRLERDARLAVVPVGYADGVQRSLGGRASVLIRGRRLPIVDRHAMNALTVDVSPLDGVLPGEEVVLYGAQGADRITSAELEHANGHIAAELYSVWGRLHPRVPVAIALTTAQGAV